MRVQSKLKGPAYDAGYDILNEVGNGLVPLCPSNGHFNRSNVSELLRVSSSVFGRVDIFIPDKPTIHTYKAIGYEAQSLERRARVQGNRLQNIVKQATEDINRVHPNQVLRWGDIEQKAPYLAQLEYLRHLFKTNDDFQIVVKSETEAVVIDKLRGDRTLDDAIELGTPYVLEELAWLSAATEILEVERTAYVYHQQWFLDRFLAGEFDHSRDNVGIVIIN